MGFCFLFVYFFVYDLTRNLTAPILHLVEHKGILCVSSNTGTAVPRSKTLPVGMPRMISIAFRMPEKALKTEPHRIALRNAMPSSDVWFNDALFVVVNLNFVCNIVLSDQGIHRSLYATVTIS